MTDDEDTTGVVFEITPVPFLDVFKDLGGCYEDDDGHIIKGRTWCKNRTDTQSCRVVRALQDCRLQSICRCSAILQGTGAV